MSLRILVVEDDLPSLELLTEVLSGVGAAVVPMSNSRQAAHAVETEKFDGIFLDFQMPEIDGQELTRLARRGVNKTTPVIMITAHDTIKNAFAAGVTAFLNKPIDRNKIAMVFRGMAGAMWVDRRRSLRVAFHVPIAFFTKTGEHRGTCIDIGMEGVSVDLAVDLGIGTSVAFDLPLSPIKTVRLAGTVAAVSATRRHSVKFAGLSDSGKQLISNVLETASRRKAT